MLYKIGTNQFRTKPKYKFWNNVFWAIVFIIGVSGMGYYARNNQIQVTAATIVYIKPTPIPYLKPELAGLEEQERAIAIIKKTWRKEWEVGVALAICESGFQEKIIGKVTHDVGYFQVNPIHGWSDEEMQNGVSNASYAYTLFKEQGLIPWNSSKGCWESEI
jgi:hypothetical protein